MSGDVHKNYLRDLGFLIKERALKAKAERNAERDGTDAHLFEAGRLMAYHEVVSMMQNQAAAFQLPIKDLSLGDIDPERDLV